MKTFVIASLFAATVLGGIAHADDAGKCGDVPQAKWMTKDAMKAKAAGMGFEVRQVKAESGCYEIYGVKDGKKVEALSNPETGVQVGVDGDD
ncbi:MULTISPECIES: PepSY domain-containing protein [unclassified Rhizobium]|uniref:PepSY domain-containing protein n=1 Tax=unclassified Rhizobium TaxID=2613769 RepID=UPI0006F3807A|nr:MULTISPECIES: PepSY domain-containing protein [unclassified Rhizobium]KQV38011.1 hypothetical protein ASC86_07115 [Rhizobium sp. Root1212]KRD30669.1 hypothetical protein ASE37_07110 [Rhizobium sp. Root268]